MVGPDGSPRAAATPYGRSFMDEAARAQEAWTQVTGRALGTSKGGGDANQRMLKGWVEFTSGAAKEGLRLYGELQIKALDGMKAVAEGAYGPQAAVRMAEENVQTLTRTAERLQATAEQAGKNIQATFT